MTQPADLTRDQVRAAVLAALGGIAPEVDPRAVRGDARLRDQFDLDSMDYLNFLIALGRDLGVEIPEADYGRVETLDACVDYVLARHMA